MIYTTCVIYNGGSYGTFIEWCLNFFSNANFPQTLPFLNSGSSHKFDGNFLHNISAIKNFISSTDYNAKKLCRFHPKITQDGSVKFNLEFASKNFQKIIFIHPCNDTLIWNINNKFEKIWQKGWLNYNEHFFQKNLEKWNHEKVSDMAPWELREFLSFFIKKQHISEVELDTLDDLQNQFPEILFISIKDLRDNFRYTMEKIFQFCEIQMINVNQIDYVFNNWIAVQHHKDKDKLVKEIIDSVNKNLNIEWRHKQLTIVDESFVQNGLRDLGLELRCYDLNVFPNSTVELKSLIYAT